MGGQKTGTRPHAVPRERPLLRPCLLIHEIGASPSRPPPTSDPFLCEFHRHLDQITTPIIIYKIKMERSGRQRPPSLTPLGCEQSQTYFHPTTGEGEMTLPTAHVGRQEAWW